MKVLVCGGRDADPSAVWNWLDSFGHQDAAEALRLSTQAKITCLIHGGASGADRGASLWGASEDGVRVVAYPADWRKHGKAAGPIRNERMLTEGRPDVVIAFAGGRGTADMVRRAEACGIPVVRPTPAPLGATRDGGGDAAI